MEPEKRRVCALILAATVVFLGLAAGVVAAESSKGAGVVTAVSGPVTVSREEALPLPLKFRDALYWRDVVEARTVVVTLSGVVEVANRLAATGGAELVGAYEAVRVSGRLDPVRLQLTPETLRQTLQGLTPPRPREVRSGDATANVSERIAQAASSGQAAVSGTSTSLSSERNSQGNGKSDARSGQASGADVKERIPNPGSRASSRSRK